MTLSRSARSDACNPPAASGTRATACPGRIPSSPAAAKAALKRGAPDAASRFTSAGTVGSHLASRTLRMANQCATYIAIDKLLVKFRWGCHDGDMRSGYFRAVVVCLLGAFVVLLGGCIGGGHALGTPGSIPVGQSTQTIDVGGVSRTFHVYRPSGLSDSVPLVVM